MYVIIFMIFMIFMYGTETTFLTVQISGLPIQWDPRRGKGKLYLYIGRLMRSCRRVRRTFRASPWIFYIYPWKIYQGDINDIKLMYLDASDCYFAGLQGPYVLSWEALVLSRDIIEIYELQYFCHIIILKATMIHTWSPNHFLYTLLCIIYKDFFAA